MRTDVANLYVALFGRAPERDGLGYWVQQLDAGKTLAAVAQEMYNTEPARATYPTFLTNEEIIGRFYTNVLGRTADADGLAYWTAKLNATGATKGSVIAEMITAVRAYAGTDAAALSSKALFENKVTVGLYYAVDLGGNDVTKAASILTGVTADASSVTAAKTGAATSVGQTLSLSVANDAVTGGTGNDTINALTIKADGTAAETLSAFDAIDGGAGSDTLNIYTTATENEAFPATATVKNVETVNVYNTAAAAALGDASKFEGVTALWQHNAAVDVTKLAATTTAGFKGVEATVAADLDVSAVDAATTVTIALDGVKGDAQTAAGTIENRADIDVDGAAVAGVTVTGTLAQKSTTSLGSAEVFTATFAGGAAAAATVIFDGRTYTSAGGLTAAAEATAFVAAYNNVAATWTAVDNGNGTVTFTKKTVGAVTDAVTADFTGTAAGQVTAAAATVQGAAAGTTGAAASLALNVSAGKDVESLTVTTAVATTLSVTENAGSAVSKDIKTLDASASAGAITFGGSITGGTAGSLATIKTGAGADTVTIVTATLKDDTATTGVDETVTASIDTAAGNDKITVNTTGTGATTVNAGEGNDTVTLTADGSGKLTINLGAGNDTLKGAGAIAGTDAVDGGEGTDTVQLNMIGASNIAAFSNFETFDAAGLAKTLDVEILAAKNTVTEFVASADVGAAAVLTNVGAGVGYRVTGDTSVANTLTLTQKTAGALTVTLDIDETGSTAKDSGAKTNVDAGVVATNATSLKAVFDSAFVEKALDASDNLTNLTVTGTKATSLEVVSGGANAINELLYTGGNDTTASKGDLLTSVTISGDRALTFDYTAADFSEITSVNASALTGALTFGLVDLKATGTLTLGSGDDVIAAHTGLGATTTAAADAALAVADLRAISGFAKGTAENATAQSKFDVVTLAGAVQAADVAATATHTVKDGLFTFNGTGPATLAAAVELVAGVVAINEAVVFEYVGNSYIFAEGGTNGGTADVLVKLTGVTGLVGLDDVNAAGTNLYVF